MRQTRYQLWSVDPLTDDARPLFGTHTKASAQRIVAAYNRLDSCHRILEVRPVEVEIPRHHVYACRARFAGSGRLVVRQIMAVDAYAAFRELARRFGFSLDHVAVWLFTDEMDAGETAVLEIDRHGRLWTVRRAAS